MADLVLVNARVVTLGGEAAPRRGAALRELSVIERGYVRVAGERIAEVGPGDPARASWGGDGTNVIDVGGAVVMPGFVDCHTHACWAGQRFDEFERKLAGATYLEILESGGGIMSTVRAVRESSEGQLVENLLRSLRRMQALGTTTAEVKSGYGLTTDDELKMLRAIRAAAEQTRMTVVPTFLGAHAIDPENPDCVEQTIEQTLPAVAEEFPGIACDAYCEQGAWSLQQTVRLFEKARSLGCPLRVHADQFNALGMTRAVTSTWTWPSRASRSSSS